MTDPVLTIDQRLPGLPPYPYGDIGVDKECDVRQLISREFKVSSMSVLESLVQSMLAEHFMRDFIFSN
ncbi:hypothetical protein HRE53_12530 [Acaryochloris sp. 'Moss Beach']|uniref:hypothetical protein n=1 Tax=Acaryochloris TaxID=155977 RepID=UPI001BAE68C7|nr:MULTISPECIES: hypothetical protein [Acaryochloris]QUY42624.1 hypothetical protein I1H34_26280 [Acaryochloris marina S15]UJB71704.1 hypothetical protein HRE53_12530 [Acaryochloris sp. 'Moss Beach']